MNRRKKKTSKQILSVKIHTWDIGCPWKYTSNRVGTATATTAVRTNIMARRIPPPAGNVGTFSSIPAAEETAMAMGPAAALAGDIGGGCPLPNLLLLEALSGCRFFFASGGGGTSPMWSFSEALR
jgi:hypothetical protein